MVDSLVETMERMKVAHLAENLAGELAALSVALLGENLAVTLVGSKAGQTADE